MQRIFSLILYYFYLILLYLFFPIFLIRVYIRQRFYPRNQGRLKERLGIFSEPRWLDQPIWIHAVSYGEAVLAEQLASAILAKFPKMNIVITTTTFTGSERIHTALGSSVFHVYLPYDLPLFVQRFIKKTTPKVVVIFETELWPTLINKLYKAGIPIVLANARLSEKSAKQYHYILPLVRYMLNQMNCVAAQSILDAERFLKLGLSAKKLEVMGSIKYDLQVNEFVIKKGKELRKVLGADRLIWVAASTHQGEEEKILQTFDVLKITYPNALLILVPRHPERFDTVAQLCEQAGYSLARRSTNSSEVNKLSALGILTNFDIFLGDTLGELLLFYAAADIAFVGGSFVPVGGHNILEPIAIGVPTLIGPYFHNFSEIINYLEREAAIQIVNTPETLAKQIIFLMQNSMERMNQIKQAQKALEKNAGALDKHLSKIINIYFGLPIETGGYE